MPIPKAIRISGYILLTIICISTIVAILLNVYFNKKLIASIKEQVSISTHDEYILSLDGLSINLFTHTIIVNNLIIAPSKNTNTNEKAKYVLRAKTLKIIDFSIWSYLFDRNLKIDRAEFEEPQISIFKGSERLPKRKGEATSIADFSLYAAFSKKLNSISINHIDIINSKFNIYKNGIDTTSIFSTNDNSISIKNFTVNAETDKNNRLFFADKFEIVMNKFYYHLENELYTLQGKSLYASYLDSILIIDSLQLMPNFSKKEFAKKADDQTSRANIIFSKVECKNMDVKSFFEYNWLIIKKVDIEECTIDVYRDNTYPLKHHIRPSLQAMVKDLPFLVDVDTVEMKNGEINFEVLNPGKSSTAGITINNINAIVTGIKNDTSSYLDDSSIKAIFNGSVLNKGKFSETYLFPLKTKEEIFYCSGNMTSMPMASFNSLIEYTKQLSITNGQLDAVSFSFVAHKNSSSGTMKFLYHGLEIETMNKNGQKNGLKEKIITFLANKLVLNDCNPSKDGHVRISKIHAEHNPYRYFINYSMQSMLSGIEPAIEGEKTAKFLHKKK